MRLLYLCVFILFLSCQSETALRTLNISTTVDIKLPVDALYGNLASFRGLHSAAPDVFISEKLENVDGAIKRTLILSNEIKLVDRLLETSDTEKYIKYETLSNSLPVQNISHQINVIKLTQDVSRVSWVSDTDVQNKDRDFVNERVSGIQETYLLSLQLLGEELEELFESPEF